MTDILLRLRESLNELKELAGESAVKEVNEIPEGKMEDL